MAEHIVKLTTKVQAIGQFGRESQPPAIDAHDPVSCKCQTRPLKFREYYESQLSVTLPWLNMTSHEVLERTHPNLPINMYDDLNAKHCHLLPSFNRINWYNKYYQPVVVAKSTKFFLSSAFLDNRIATDVRPCIRILAWSKDTNPTAPWCRIWFNTTGPPAVSRVIRIDYLDWQPRSGDRHMTFLLTCRIPKYNSHLTPLSVSVVSSPCEKYTKNLLKVFGSMERDTKTALVNSSKNEDSSPVWNAAVCGPALSYYHEDVSIQLVEWLELLRALGFARVFLYETEVHPNIEKVLRYYEAEGFVGVTKFAYHVNDPILRKLWALMEPTQVLGMENLLFTDCVLRHMHKYRFLARLNLDQMPMLPNHDSFPLWLNDQLFENSIGNGSAENLPPSYDLRWYYHHDDLGTPASSASLPEYLKFLRQSKRTVMDIYPTNYNPTYDMNLVTGVFSNDVAVCASGKCRGESYQCPRDVAYLGLYTKTCGEACKKPGSTVEVSALRKYKGQVSSAVAKVLQELRLVV
ncbi:uncharacterized protein LOC125047633 isoform X2 [Penaeus chinensis]|uniref:uncharacterized protein LOC125047633 isoform X2 n=1 Tax=Penaeus chinensis TaxID=139456 RepID=UPI001FB76D5A|nr:uncharacterized protein LOC125047633 isoform X2 [Penaeus chinensis]XP_047501901.1 uncharacterized protein LOC125047633 isoform X2 [Penaeus chinensis]